MKVRDIYYCDRCKKPIDNQPEFEIALYHICPDCQLALYQKIFGIKKENDGQ